MTRTTITLFLLACWVLSFGQSTPDRVIQINFIPTYHEQALDLTDDVFKSTADDVIIETLRFYIGQIKLTFADQVVWSENNYYLVDAEDKNSLSLQISPPSDITFDHIEFSFGVDSFTNVSGAYGGDLDPTKGMYWTWQNGYINFKLEGISKACPTRKNNFLFHLGGYNAPFASAQIIQLNVENDDAFNIGLDIKEFLAAIDLSTQHTLMSPSADAVKLSQLISTLFKVDE